MKLPVPRIKVDIRSNLPLEEVANRVSEKLFPGCGWHRSKSGYYEDVPALDLDVPLLGLRLSLVEQAALKLYTLEGHFDLSSLIFKNVEPDEHEMGHALSALLKSVPGFSDVTVAA